MAGMVGIEVLHHDEGHSRVHRELRQKLAQRFQATGGGAEADYRERTFGGRITARHQTPPGNFPQMLLGLWWLWHGNPASSPNVPAFPVTAPLSGTSSYPRFRTRSTIRCTCSSKLSEPVSM